MTKLEIWKDLVIGFLEKPLFLTYNVDYFQIIFTFFERGFCAASNVKLLSQVTQKWTFRSLDLCRFQTNRRHNKLFFYRGGNYSKKLEIS